MNEVRAWLNGSRSWDAGLQLYLKFGNDPAMAMRLRAGNAREHSGQLFKALKDLLQPAALAPVPTPPAPAIKTENEVSAVLKRTADKLFKEMQNTRSQLLAICPTEESPLDTDPEQKKLRGQLARQVMALQLHVDEAYDDYRYALEHGVAREKPGVEIEDVSLVMLHQLISNLQKRLSKLRNGKQTANTPILIQEKETQLENYKAQYARAKASGSQPTDGGAN